MPEYTVYIPMEFVKTIRAETPDAAKRAVDALCGQWREGEVGLSVREHVFFSDRDIEVETEDEL